MSDLDVAITAYLDASHEHIRTLRDSTIYEPSVMLAWRAVLVAERAMYQTMVDLRADVMFMVDSIETLDRDLADLDASIREVYTDACIVIEDRHNDRHADRFDVAQGIIDQVQDLATSMAFGDGEVIRYGLIDTNDPGAARLDGRRLPCVTIHRIATPHQEI